MDFADVGQATTEAHIESLLMVQRTQPRLKLEITGACHNPRCGDDCGSRAFCNAECRDEYDRLNKRIAR